MFGGFHIGSFQGAAAETSNNVFRPVMVSSRALPSMLWEEPVIVELLSVDGR